MEAPKPAEPKKVDLPYYHGVTNLDDAEDGGWSIPRTGIYPILSCPCGEHRVRWTERVDDSHRVTFVCPECKTEWDAYLEDYVEMSER